MKNAIFYFAAVLFLFGCSDEVLPPELNESPKIKTITELTFTGTEVWGEQVKGSFRDKNVFNFDDRGNMVLSFSYGLSKTWEFRFVVEYDENNRYLRGNQYWPNGNLVFTYKMVYDDTRKALEWSVYQADGGIEDIYIMIYGDGKNVTEERNCDLKTFDNFNQKTTYKYDTKNNVIEEKEYFNGKLYSTTTYYYPEFDSNGSWTKRNEYYAKVGDDPVLVRMYERVNEYY